MLKNINLYDIIFKRLGVAPFYLTQTDNRFNSILSNYSEVIMITQKQVKELFNYDPETGILTWRIKPANRVKIDNVVGCLDNKGYRRTTIDGKVYLNHRISYLHYHGYLPQFIDHKKGMSNKINNLRKCTSQQNNQNSKLCRRNTSGVKGVSWHKSSEKWVAHLSINGKDQYLGCYDDIKEAESVVKAAREKHHGEFACHGEIQATQ